MLLSSIAVILAFACLQSSESLLQNPAGKRAKRRNPTPTTALSSASNSFDSATISRRNTLQLGLLLATNRLLLTPVASWADFAPGGTLVNRQVGVTVGNPEASRSRKPDNSNVLFDKDYYFKFGAAAPWIEPDSTEFPTTMPFTRSQQRYDTLKKYQDRVQAGMDKIRSIQKECDNDNRAQLIADPTATDVYALRPMGLMANGFLASENTGATNELFLARWYINEIYLGINDIRTATSASDAQRAYQATKKAANSFLSMINRVITPKVGDKFDYL